ncbi:MAG: flagellar hook-length control protein FliK [Desulfatitalea sp.]|nr:flagellar hook-length control protein FliK [Desulfatitalea sp.]
MQCQMKYLEVLPKGVGQGVQKVAVKMPAGGDANGSADGTGFADIMAALMSLPADQLRQSLAQLDRVCVEGQSKEWVPLLDLTEAAGANGGMLKLLKVEPQANKTAAAMLQLKLQQMQTQDTTAQPDAELLPQPNPVDGKSLAPQEAPKTAADMQEQMAAFFASAQSDGQELPKQTLNSDLSAELTRALTGRDQKTETAEDQPLNPMPDLTDKTKNLQPKQMEQVSAKNPIDLTALQRQPATDGKESFAAVVETKSSKQKGNVAAAKAAPAAVAHAAAKSAVAEQPVDMGASLDKALTQQRPIQKEEKPVVDGRLQAQAETAGNTGTTQAVPTSGEPVQTVESRLGGVEARTAQHVKESDETTAAPKEMQTDVIRQIVQRMTLRSDGRNNSMQIKLKPEFLGNLHMEVMTENQQVTVRMTAESQAVKGIIEQNLHVLKNELQQHGLQIQKFDVLVSQDNDAWRNGQQQTAFRQAQDRGYRSGSGRNGQFADSAETDAADGSVGTGSAYGEKSSVDFFA